MSPGTARSPVHRIIDALHGAVQALGLGVPPLFVERWGVAVHQALSSRAREFHTHQHVLDLIVDADAIETIAALYHDIVYVQVDLGVPPHYAEILEPLISREREGWRILPHAGIDPTARLVLDVFGHQPGEVLTPYNGLNELASGLVAAKEMEGVFSNDQQLALAACIEATIPFRAPEKLVLDARLTALGVPAAERTVMVRRATRLANNDVGNFAEADAAIFLDNTWKLLPETNPTLHTANTYTVHEYRVALQKMEGFLAGLPPERVFRMQAGEPAPEEHKRRVEAAGRNMALAVRYMRTKLYSTAVVEALAYETGGDAPIDLFMGGIGDANGERMRRIEQFLPALATPPEPVDLLLQGLLDGGRLNASAFDLSPSPIASYLHVTLGERVVMEGLVQARDWWQGKSTARTFLDAQPTHTTAAIARAAANISDTRRELLEAVASRLTTRKS
ncbi:MAG: hypothetical protein JNJ54_08735 [Myxococcaceae bacterium]|nr:hypothetical protein [Myxococcaceae bacterium]